MDALEDDCLCMSQAWITATNRRTSEILADHEERLQIANELGAFASFDLARVRHAAQAFDLLAQSSPEARPLLRGAIVAVKDVVAVAGMPMRAGSRATSTEEASRDATVVNQLRAEGALIVGKTSTDEFALGSTTRGAANPHDRSRIPGGSSGGSAITVAVGGAHLAIGTDTGGSVRLPAILCGVFGLKPTIGRISTSGVLPLSPSLDTVGLFARCVNDLRIALDSLVAPGTVMLPHQGRYPDPPVTPFTTDPLPGLWPSSASVMQVGVIELEDWVEPIDSTTWSCYLSAVETLKERGSSTFRVHLPDMKQAPSVLMDILLPEFAHWMDQTRSFGLDSELCGVEVVSELHRGRRMSAVSYLRALHRKRELASAWGETLRSLDAIVIPATPRGATKRGEDVMRWDPGFEESVESCFGRFTCAPSLAGFPVLAAPWGTDGEGLPVGVQLIAKPYDEWAVLQLGGMLHPTAIPVIPNGGRR